MVIDTSALLAILQNEPERRKFNEAIEAAETRSLSTASLVECSMILESRFGSDAVRDLHLFLPKAQITLVPVDALMRTKPILHAGRFVNTAKGGILLD